MYTRIFFVQKVLREFIFMMGVLACCFLAYMQIHSGKAYAGHGLFHHARVTINCESLNYGVCKCR